MVSPTLAFDLWADGSDLCVTVIVDDQTVYHGTPDATPHHLVVPFADDREHHQLVIDLQGKSPEHTLLDSDGNIVKDRLVHIDNVRLADIELGHLFHTTCVYTHDRNGTSGVITQPFFGTMGCNGRVEFRWSSPFYLWLLENT